MSDPDSDSLVPCPVCSRSFHSNAVENHVNRCLFLNEQDQKAKPSSKRVMPNNISVPSSQGKRLKLSPQNIQEKITLADSTETSSVKFNYRNRNIPLAEQMRPNFLDDIIGQNAVFGPGSMLHSLLERKQVPNMILWGPPGCGKTSLANVIANMCKGQNNLRFVKLSATMAGINDVKDVVKIAKNEMQYKRQTVLFMDEIHRFNKLQQDTFLPHVENGTIILIGATTENPSFSLNNALLSRCRVVVMEKLSVEDVMVILTKAVKTNKNIAVFEHGNEVKRADHDSPIKIIIEPPSLRWLAEVCDGDARVALGALELAIAARQSDEMTDEPTLLTLDDIKEGIKRTHTLYDRNGEEHYNIISAMHKSIRASDENAALYWVARALHGGEDPLYVARRLVRASAEDIGLADPSALTEAVACLHGCQQIGMPECDVLLAQCAVRLARAPKSTQVYRALVRCKKSLAEAKGPLPSVPLHLRNAPTKLMKQLGYAHGYNMLHRDESGLTYMPEGLEHVNFFDCKPDGV